MAKKKYRQREVIWEVLCKHGPLTASQICDYVNGSKVGVTLIPRTTSTLMRASHLFAAHSNSKVRYLGGQIGSVIVWRARTIDELVELFREPRRQQYGLHKLPSIVKSEVESRLEELQ